MQKDGLKKVECDDLGKIDLGEAAEDEKEKCIRLSFLGSTL